MLQPSIGLAFLAGLVSFLSPCVFPLVPVYAGYLGGRAAAERRSRTVLAGAAPTAETTPLTARLSLLLNGVAFVLGFSLIFVLFYYVFSALEINFFIEHETAFDVVAGVVIIGFALQMLGLLRIPWLTREFRVHTSPVPGLAGSAILGVSFACGWSPCLGPELGAILTLARIGDFGGLPFMLLYCLGLAVPFLVVALLAERLRDTLARVNRHLNVVNLVAGGLLLVFGVLLMTGSITLLAAASPKSPFDI